jgi:NAD(P)H dehydrogenase (quinone)
MKKILVIKSHPKENSFCNALTDKYIDGAEKSDSEIKILDLKELSLEKFIKYEHEKNPKLSPDLLNAQKLIKWANHLVFTYPTWWATPPALLKVFFEMVFEPGFTHKYHKSSGIFPKWDKLLFGKTARIIVTMDSPPWYYKLFAGDPGGKMMKDIMGFTGVKLLKKHYFGSVKMSSKEKRGDGWKKCVKLG